MTENLQKALNGQNTAELNYAGIPVPDTVVTVSTPYEAVVYLKSGKRIRGIYILP